MGRVIAAAADKTVVVAVERKVKHPLYGKFMRRRKKLHVHDEKNEARVGDQVRIVETRPYSKLKRWRLLEVIGRN
jgi:small subunit ribosomal protein S17